MKRRLPSAAATIATIFRRPSMAYLLIAPVRVSMAQSRLSSTRATCWVAVGAVAVIGTPGLGEIEFRPSHGRSFKPGKYPGAVRRERQHARGITAQWDGILQPAGGQIHHRDRFTAPISGIQQGAVRRHHAVQRVESDRYPPGDRFLPDRESSTCPRSVLRLPGPAAVTTKARRPSGDTCTLASGAISNGIDPMTRRCCRSTITTRAEAGAAPPFAVCVTGANCDVAVT